jgi:hypothetical protein
MTVAADPPACSREESCVPCRSEDAPLDARAEEEMRWVADLRQIQATAAAVACPQRQKEQQMRFLGYTLGDPTAPIPEPSPEMYAKMGEFIEEATKAGVLVATGGLGPVDEATRVKYEADGTYTVLDGPFSEAKELIGGWALMETRDKDEAIEWTKRFLAIAGPGESTIRPVY